MPAGPSTLKEIAQQAGVSIMTVSRALRAHSEVSEATRKRIQQIADQMGYRPDARMSELMAYIRRKEKPQYSGTLAILRGCAKTGDEIPHYVTHDREIRSAHDCADALGYEIDEFGFPFDGSQDRRLASILKARGITGLIVYPPPQPNHSTQFDFSPFCPIAYGVNMKSPTLDRVIGNTQHAVQISINKLLELGYRRIGMALFDVTNVNRNYTYLPSYLLHQDRTNSPDKIPYIVYDDLGDRGYACFMRWVKKYRPEVVLSHDTVALEWLIMGGMKIPHEIAYVNLSLKETDRLPSAGTSENPEEVGALLVDVTLSLLHSKFAGLRHPPRDIYSQATWHDGPTVRKKVSPK